MLAMPNTTNINIFHEQMRIGTFETFWDTLHPPIKKLYNLESLPFFEKRVLKTFQERTVKNEWDAIHLFSYYLGETIIRLHLNAEWVYPVREEGVRAYKHAESAPFVQIRSRNDQILLAYHPYRPIMEMAKIGPMNLPDILEKIQEHLFQLFLLQDMKKGRRAILSNGIEVAVYRHKGN